MTAIILRDSKIHADLAFRLRTETAAGNFAMTTSLISLDWLVPTIRFALNAICYALYILFTPVHITRAAITYYPTIRLVSLTAIVLAWLYAAYIEFGLRQIFRT